MKAASRRGYTLTELLVTTTIMASLMGLVISSTRQSRGTSTDIRRGARQLASVLLASQSLSLGSPTGSAVIFDPDGAASEVVTHARRYPFIEGVVASGMAPVNLSTTKAYVKLQPQNDTADSLQHGYCIRFMDRVASTQGPASDWFTFDYAAPEPNGTQATGTVSYRGETSPRTTLWPAAASGTLSFQCARYPLPTGLVHAMPKGVAVDLRYSGLANAKNATWGRLDNSGAIAIGFDTVGAMDAIMQNVLPKGGVRRTVQPYCPQEDIYLFVTARDDIDGLTPNPQPLERPDALWVVIHPKTGRVTVSANVPATEASAALEPNRQRAREDALLKAREQARKGITLGG